MHKILAGGVSDMHDYSCIPELHNTETQTLVQHALIATVITYKYSLSSNNMYTITSSYVSSCNTKALWIMCAEIKHWIQIFNWA